MTKNFGTYTPTCMTHNLFILWRLGYKDHAELMPERITLHEAFVSAYDTPEMMRGVIWFGCMRPLSFAIVHRLMSVVWYALGLLLVTLVGRVSSLKGKGMAYPLLLFPASSGFFPPTQAPATPARSNQSLARISFKIRKGTHVTAQFYECMQKGHACMHSCLGIHAVMYGHFSSQTAV